VILDAAEDVGEEVEGVDPARLAGRDERVEPCEAPARLDVADEEVVLPAERDPSGRPLRGVVVERHALVVEEDAELGPLRERVPDRDAQRTLRWMPRLLHVEPSLDGVADRPGPDFPKLQVCVSGKSALLRLVLNAVQVGDEVEDLLRDRGVEEVPTDVRVACGAATARNLLDVVVAAVAVDEEEALRSVGLPLASLRMRRRVSSASTMSRARITSSSRVQIGASSADVRCRRSFIVERATGTPFRASSFSSL